ncbi:MAG: hypothetical protein Q9181_006391, partial [Wetmoreana brouardii]
MRLQLTVQRHGLPAARVLWATDLGSTFTSAVGPGTTISQLLEQINDIIPLESEDWGLEDYTVEVEGFECLHFSQAGQVLKEDDEVKYKTRPRFLRLSLRCHSIRPLNTSDLRFRKVSGRHQISADGKHLIDGVAFGRPFIRRAERPAIRIPPRKRRRLVYDEEDDDDSFEAQRQVVVHNGFDDEEGSTANSDYNEDEAITAEDEADLAAELGGIRNDQDAAIEDNGQAYPTDGSSPPISAATLGSVKKRRPRRVCGLGLRASSLLVDENGVPYPEKYNNPLLDMFEDDEPVQEAPHISRTKNEAAATSSKYHPHRCSNIVDETHGNDATKGSRSKTKIVRFEEAKFATPATIHLEESDDSDDDDFEPFDDAMGELDESDKENATPGSRISSDKSASAAKSGPSSSSESDSDSDETSSSGSSESGTTGSAGEDENFVDEATGYDVENSDTSSSDTSSSSGSSSSPGDEQRPRHSDTPNKAAESSLPQETIFASQKKDYGNPIEPQGPVPPGSGQRETRMRNQRRKDRKKLNNLKKAGVLPPSATTADMRSLNTSQEGRLEAEVDPNVDPQDESVSDLNEDAKFEAKRLALLRAITSGGVDVEGDLERQDSPNVAESPSMKMSPYPSKAAVVKKSASSASDKTLVGPLSLPQTAEGITAEVAADQMQEPEIQESWSDQDQPDRQDLPFADASQSADSIPMPITQKPHMRLDKESSRRLIFGALGHRTPKTQEDEASLQAKLMEGAKPRRKQQSYSAPDDGLGAEPLPSEDFDSWKDKIELSAVECCYDGIELSTPPFPFVQRWDPQQQRGYFAGNAGYSQNGKKRKRNNKYYEPSFEPLEEGEASKRQQQPPYSVKKRFDDGHSTTSAEIDQNRAQEGSDDISQAANDQLLRETEETTEDTREVPNDTEDLPCLPADVTACADLVEKTCSAGTIIAFKQLDMSAATKWQPRVSDYRTALIDSVLDDGTLSLRMALRDLPQEEKQYDEETGKRLYSKFEMPGFNETNPSNNNGLLELAFEDLIEPKLVRAAEKEPDSILFEKEPVGDSTYEQDVAQGDQSLATRGGQYSAPCIIFDQEAPKEVYSRHNDAELTGQFSEDIKGLLKDADWHSSIHLTENSQHEESEQLERQHGSRENPEATSYDGHLSPRFDGFSSSPPAEEYQEATDRVIYPTLKSISSPAAVQDETTMGLDQAMADSSSQADREALRAIREDFETEVKQPSPPFDSDLNQNPNFQSSSRPESPISPPPKKKPTSTPVLPQSLRSTIPDSQPLPLATTTTSSQSATPSDLASNGHHSSSDDEFPSLETVFSSFSSQRATSIKPEHHSSDDEANTSLFLQTLPSHSQREAKTLNHSKTPKSKSKITGNGKNSDIDCVDDDDAYEDFKPPCSSAPARLLEKQPSETAIPKAVKNDKLQKRKQVKKEGIAKQEKKKKPRPNKFEPAPRSSQDYIGTQVVDLTISSDPVTGMEEDEYVESTGGSSLPKGPGW